MEMILLVLAMGAVTYLPRMAPLTLMQNAVMPQLIRSFFRFIPYAALGALIFPGILTSAGPERMPAAGIGALLAVGVALVSENVMLVVAAGIAGVFAANLLLY
ncbi:MAG: AzlD domain-containing protein [Negativicutes bacterium]|nr:AzlD domain-containing protein [Negativicutes bacterium]